MEIKSNKKLIIIIDNKTQSKMEKWKMENYFIEIILDLNDEIFELNEVVIDWLIIDWLIV